MTIDPERLERLDDLLHDLSPDIAQRLARAVEIDRLRGGSLPHDDILKSLRPSLRQVDTRRRARMPTARRLISYAFEDILIDGPRLAKQRGRVLRSSLAPVWSWVVDELLADRAAAMLDGLTRKLASGGADFADAELAAFRGAAAEAILARVPTGDLTDERTIEAGKRLGGTALAADAHDMARMMQIGGQVTDLWRQIVKPIASLCEEDIAAIRVVWERLQAEQSEAAPYLVFAVLGRLEKPWEIMRLAGAMSRRMDDILISRTDLGDVGTLLLSDLERCVSHLESLRVSEMQSIDVLPAVETFATLSTGIVRELGIKREGPWGKRLMNARSDMADAMDRLLDRAGKKISGTLPMSRRTGLTFRTRRLPDMTRTFDTRRANHAIELATVIAGSRTHAMAGAFAGLIAQIDEEVGSLLRHYTADMLDVLRDSPPHQGRQAAAYVEHAIDLTRILLGEEDAELLRRRAVAAESVPVDEAERISA